MTRRGFFSLLVVDLVGLHGVVHVLHGDPVHQDFLLHPLLSLCLHRHRSLHAPGQPVLFILDHLETLKGEDSRHVLHPGDGHQPVVAQPGVGVLVVSRTRPRLGGAESLGLRVPSHLSELASRVVTFADTEGGEPEPVREDAPALVAGVEGEQSLEPVLLLTPAAGPAEHLVVLSPADLHVDVLLEGVEVEEGEGVVPGVVGPVGGRDA